ncbi:PRC-barrel domain protein [Novosphingobium sp. PhB165]|uniref:PRC-barrel domain-containing protein n=1 Tax=Novosphingobium sp. PhB165 TaxID=2485105 RepID=UPI0010D3BCFD|nr:PRC-barrel domain-containing protein [Novosphingobium sp. PhB165]TCM14423.1 PRC-barrel domain protein [Novosphingobium sp. PhB165]
MEDIAGWIAPAATMIAAMMTGANLGVRISGWDLVVFAIASIAGSVVGLSSGQTNLLATNGLLTFVNLIAVWRWLGKQGTYEDGGKLAAEASRRSAYPTLFTTTGIAAVPVAAANGKKLGNAGDVLVSCKRGKVSYVVADSSGVGGIGEELRAVGRAQFDFACDRVKLRRLRAWFESLPPLADGDWAAARPEMAWSPDR